MFLLSCILLIGYCWFCLLSPFCFYSVSFISHWYFVVQLTWQEASWACQLHFNLCTFQSTKDAEKGLLQHHFVQYPTGTHNLLRRYNTYFLTFLDLDTQLSLDCNAVICWLYQYSYSNPHPDYKSWKCCQSYQSVSATICQNRNRSELQTLVYSVGVFLLRVWS